MAGIGWTVGSAGAASSWLTRSEAGAAPVAVPGFRTRLVWQTLALSGALNLIQLSLSLYVLRIYDHVLPSRSIAALGFLTVLVFFVQGLFAILEMLRSRLLFRAGVSFMQALDQHVFHAMRVGARRRAVSAVHDVERVGRFMTNAGPSAFCDIFWAPIFLLAVFLLHPVLGCFAGAGLLLVAGVGIAAEVGSRDAAQTIARTRHMRFALVREAEKAKAARNGTLLHAVLLVRWHEASQAYFDLKSRSAHREMKFAAIGKSFRLMLQSGGLALGAMLVVEGALSAGGLVASSVIMGRMFASLDAALAHWRSFVAARASYACLTSGNQAVQSG
jgi:ABC-type protease/lipase transport system fused ATPase/permease subunit